MKRPRLPRYVSQFRDAQGVSRFRFRRGGFSRYLRASIDSPEFAIEYAACMAGAEAPASAGEARSLAGSIGELCARYRQSELWAAKAPTTQAQWLLALGRMQANLRDNAVRGFTARHAGTILAKMSDRPHAANNFRKKMKALWTWAVRNNLATTNPWAATAPYKAESAGHLSWTEEHIAAYTARWPVGTREHLAMAIMLNTFARRSDAVVLGRQHARGGRRIRFRSVKTGIEVDVPIMPDLAAALAAAPADSMTFLLTDYGAPFTAAGFGNWFREACIAAGVPGRSHGLRKAAARRMAEAGATVPELMAWGGWKTEREPQRYIEDANRAHLADNAATKLSMSRPQIDNPPPKPL